MINIAASFTSTHDKANTIEPLTLGVLKLASSNLAWGHAIRKLAVITVPIDHIIKAVAVPFIEIGTYFRDIYNEKQLGMKILKGIITPIWLPIRVGVKTACFALYYFTVGLQLPYKRPKEIFRFEDPKNSYKESMDKLQRSFGVYVKNYAERPKSPWKEKFIVPNNFNAKITSTIKKTLDKLIFTERLSVDYSLLRVKFEKVFLCLVGRGDRVAIPELNLNESVETYCGVFGADGPFLDNRKELKNKKVLVIQIGDTPAEMKVFSDESTKCKHYVLSFEQYSKLPYEIPIELQEIIQAWESGGKYDYRAII